MNFAERRKQVFEKMERQSALILFSGIESHVSADEYAPFEADRNFFYLTGLNHQLL
jgi:Xaa-Pro aminopeptidase